MDVGELVGLVSGFADPAGLEQEQIKEDASSNPIQVWLMGIRTQRR